jgi:hypothetical protein
MSESPALRQPQPLQVLPSSSSCTLVSLNCNAEISLLDSERHAMDQPAVAAAELDHRYTTT